MKNLYCLLIFSLYGVLPAFSQNLTQLATNLELTSTCNSRAYELPDGNVAITGCLAGTNAPYIVQVDVATIDVLDGQGRSVATYGMVGDTRIALPYQPGMFILVAKDIKGKWVARQRIISSE